VALLSVAASVVFVGAAVVLGDAHHVAAGALFMALALVAALVAVMVDAARDRAH
jgi:hypothetical protein